VAQDLLSQGAAWLAGIVMSHAATPVSYRRGTTTLQIVASKGRTSFDVTEPEGSVLRVDSVDFIVASAALDLGSGLVLPKRGDRITDAQGVEHEVSHPAGGQAPYGWCDPARQLLRIHTKRVGADTP
jgi:hypothetical protein